MSRLSLGRQSYAGLGSFNRSPRSQLALRSKNAAPLLCKMACNRRYGVMHSVPNDCADGDEIHENENENKHWLESLSDLSFSPKDVSDARR